MIIPTVLLAHVTGEMQKVSGLTLNISFLMAPFLIIFIQTSLCMEDLFITCEM